MIDFIKFLVGLRDGETATEIETAWFDLLAECQEMRKHGELRIALAIEPTGTDRVKILDQVKVVHPKPDTFVTLYGVEGGPGSGQGRTRLVRAHGPAPTGMVDPETGEIVEV